MNKLFMIVVSVCCLLMTACGTENDETPQGFRIVDTDVDLVAGGGTVEVALQAAGELTAVSGADWCRVIEVTNEKITLLARANYEYVSRATQVTVSDGSNEQKIVVTQAGNIFVADIDRSDSSPFAWLQNSIRFSILRSSFVKRRSDIFQERFVRKVFAVQGNPEIDFIVRKGAEGQEGEYHCQRQKGTDKARSF